MRLKRFQSRIDCNHSSKSVCYRHVHVHVTKIIIKWEEQEDGRVNEERKNTITTKFVGGIYIKELAWLRVLLSRKHTRTQTRTTNERPYPIDLMLLLLLLIPSIILISHFIYLIGKRNFSIYHAMDANGIPWLECLNVVVDKSMK